MTVPTRILSVFGLLCALSLMVYSGIADRFDHPMLISLAKLQTPSSVVFWRTVTWLGAPVLVSAIACVVFVVFYRNGKTGDATRIAIAVLAATALDMPLKYVFHRARPLDNFSGVMPTSFSFPSGHVLFATAFYVSFALVLAKGRKRASQRLIWMAAFGVVVLVLLSRLCLGVHYPSDVSGGLLIGFICVLLAGWMVRPEAP